MISSQLAPKNLWKLGKLLELRVAGLGIVNFRRENVGKTFYLCADEQNECLWIVNAKIGHESEYIAKNEIELMGEIIHVVYQTEKTHLGDSEPVNYKHRFGDEGGERPEFGLDRDGFAIIAGGDYIITAAGIRD